MLTTVALLAFANLALGQAEGLSLGDTRFTYGVLGPARKDHRMLPGDKLFVAFDIKGITVDSDNRVHYRTAIDISDSKGKTFFKQAGQDQTVINVLGGNSFPAYARVDLSMDQAPGDYALNISVTDLGNNKTQKLAQKFTVLPKAFGIVGLTTSADQDGNLPAGLLGEGQSVWLHAAVVGFERGKGQPNIDLEARITDENGKPTTAKPFTSTLNKDIPANAGAVPLQFLLSLNRAGKFTVDLKATDKLSGKSFNVSFPITVLPHK
jgi:hypothetical protein